MDYEQIKFWLQALNMLGVVGVAVYTWIATSDKDNSQHIKAVEEAMTRRIAELVSRLDRVETSMQHIPTQQELASLQGDMKSMKTAQDAMRDDFRTVRQSLTRIEDFLLKR